MCTNFLKLPHWVNAHHLFLCQAYKDSLMYWAEQQGLKECSLCTEQYSEKPSGMGAAVCPCGWNYLVGYIFRILCALSWSFSEVMQHMVIG